MILLYPNVMLSCKSNYVMRQNCLVLAKISLVLVQESNSPLCLSLSLFLLY